MIEGALKSHYDWIAERMRPDSAFSTVVGSPQMIALAACFAEGHPQIIEFESSGDSDFHEHFHAIGSGANTAYAVWRTLGGRRLRELGEDRAVHVALRIMRTAVAVDMMGVSDPYTVFVVSRDSVRQLPSADVDSEMQAVQEWEEQQIQQLLG